MISGNLTRDCESYDTASDNHYIVHALILSAVSSPHSAKPMCYPTVMSARSRRTFQQLVTLPDGAIPLAEAALLMACEEYPQLEISPYLDQLDEIADAAPHVRPDGSPMDNAAVLNEVLFDRFGFKGNSDDYYDPRNSFFNDVLDRRLGIPITLSAVYIEVASV